MVNNSNKSSIESLIPATLLTSYVLSNTIGGVGVEAFNNAPEYWGLIGAVLATRAGYNLETLTNLKARMPSGTGVLRKSVEAGFLGGIISYVPAKSLSEIINYIL